MNDEVNNFLMGSGAKSAFNKDTPVGTVIRGTIIKSEMMQQTSFTDGSLLFWRDGNPKMQAVITIATELRDDEDDDGERRLYAKGNLAKAIREAVKKASGPKGQLAEGGVLAVQYTGEEPTAERGMSPAKLYVAQYAPPPPLGETAATSLGEPIANLL